MCGLATFGQRIFVDLPEKKCQTHSGFGGREDSYSKGKTPCFHTAKTGVFGTRMIFGLKRVIRIIVGRYIQIETFPIWQVSELYGTALQKRGKMLYYA